MHTKSNTTFSKEAKAWAFYDWANSVHPLIITTAIFPIFYQAVTTKTLPDGSVSDIVNLFGISFKNSEIYLYTGSLSFLIVAFISPLLSGMADYMGNKKQFMAFFCYLGSFSCAMLYFFDGSNLFFGLLFFMLSSIGYWGSFVFYNAFLPEITPAHQQDLLSARAYSLGYLGSSLLLILNLIMIMVWDVPTKYCFVLVGLWWAGFAQMTLKKLPKGSSQQKIKNKVIWNGFIELKNVWCLVKQNKQIRRYLLAFFIYSMGVQTIMFMATLFGASEINWGTEEGAQTGLIVAVLLIQFIAIGGSYFFAFLAKKLGNINTLAMNTLIWIAVCVIAFNIYTPNEFYILAGIVGLLMGGIQTLSRSTYSQMVPQTQDLTSFFSFYDVTEKLAIVIGTFSYAYIERLAGDMRTSVLILLIFFILGFFALLRLNYMKLKSNL